MDGYNNNMNMNQMNQPAMPPMHSVPPEMYIPQAPRKRGTGRAIMVIILILLIAGTNVYWWQTTNAQKEEVNNALTAQKIKLEDISGQLEKLTSSLSSLSLEDKTTQDTSSPNDTNTKAQAFFNKCGSVSLFENETWYENWKTAVTNTERSNAFDPTPLSGNITLESVSDVCYSNQLHIVISLIRGDERGQGFKLLRYDTETESMTIASREDFEGKPESLWYQWHTKRNNTPIEKDGIKYFPWFSPPTQFGTRENNLLLLTTTTKDSACSNTFEYAYDIEKNYLFLRNLCQTCGDTPPSCADLSQF